MSEQPKLMLDMYTLTEDQRIELIAQHVQAKGSAEFIVDGDKLEKGKADRYVRKLKAKCERIYEVERKKNTPVKNVTWVKVALRCDA